MAAIASNGHIRNGLPGKPMRMAMETKALLGTKGSMYVGNGNSDSVELTGTTGGKEEYTIPQTVALNPPTADGNYVLVCRVSGGVATVGWVSSDNLNGAFVTSV